MSGYEEWAEDHGYYPWTCNRCGMSGYTDTTPECMCPEVCKKCKEETL